MPRSPSPMATAGALLMSSSPQRPGEDMLGGGVHLETLGRVDTVAHDASKALQKSSTSQKTASNRSNMLTSMFVGRLIS